MVPREFILRGFRMPTAETVAPAARDAQRVAERPRQATGQKAHFGRGGPVLAEESAGVPQQDLGGGELGALDGVRLPGDRAVPSESR
ncbi:hypothetical protein San01_39480 [Streptomyces angustmyceticus]|uniref:Uncharacterized protein n=1 Tax=Streptomyces angustmyceticus TaxID=285578 RepID=A0A5J4LHS1_9ACTN|nr:hypothetical protein San01_39480 [Streptomyces angustmyceticus]